MRTFWISCALAVTLVATPSLAEEAGWTIHKDIADAVEATKANSDSVSKAIDAGIKNRMVYGTGIGHDPMLPLHDMLACIDLSNPGSTVDLHTGKAIDLTVHKAAFPGGTWDANIVIGEQAESETLVRKTHLVLQSIKVGTYVMGDKKDWVHTIRWLTRSCRDGKARRKQTLEEKVIGKPVH